MENLGKRKGTTEGSITNRIQEMEDSISCVEDTIKEIDALVKENTESKKFLTQYIQKIWDTMKRPNLRIIRLQEKEVLKLKDTENIFSKITAKTFLT